MRTTLVLGLALASLFFAASAFAADFDPVLQAKADAFQIAADEWHTPGLGGLVSIYFTDETRQTADHAEYTGDSTIWTGMYLAAEAFRYRVTGDPAARADVILVANYFRDLMDITDTLGYIGRYAGPDEYFYNATCDDNCGWHVNGTGDWEGYFWIHETSRDQYSGYMLGMSTAYDMLDDPDVRFDIKQAFREVVEMLVENQWHITDENGEWTGNNASWVGPSMRLSWLVQAAHVIDEPYYWQLLEEQYQANKPLLWIDTFAGVNKFSEYFGNNLRHNAFLPIFRYWPKRDELLEIWDIWQSANRTYVKDTHNPWFDEVHIAGCLRLGNCDQAERDAIAEDVAHTLELYFEPPAWKRAVTCSTQPLDDFSIAAFNFLQANPWLQGIIDIHPQTAEAREVNDRHWTDMYWQSTPFEESCSHGADPTFEGPGMDWLLAYYVGVYYGLLPGDGPYGDDELIDDDSDDTSDDTASDDTGTDDTEGDDADDDIADDDETDDSAIFDDDDTASTPPSGDDDDDNSGCGC